MFRRIISYILTVSIVLSCRYVMPFPSVQAKEIKKTESPDLKENSYKEGRVIVSIASSGNNALTKEGRVSFDNKIKVEHSWDFGKAGTFAKNTAQRLNYRNKTLYVATVSSESYSTKELISELEDEDDVISVRPDYCQRLRSVNDTYADWQWYLDGVNAPGSRGIRYSELDQSINTDSSTPVVAVVDTGVDYTHEDLSGQMWINTDELLEGTYGYDFGDDDSDPMDSDIESHGTHCAGIIGAAVNNNAGIAGVCSNVKIMAIKVFDSEGDMYNSSIIAGYNYIYKAQQMGVNIVAVNCSWGGGKSDPMMEAMINKIGEAGALTVFSSGNDGIDHDGCDGEYNEVCPYDIKSPYTVITGASDGYDGAAVFSDYGASSVDMFAPGTNILSTVGYSNIQPMFFPESDRKNIFNIYSSFDNGSESDISMYYAALGSNVAGVEYVSDDAYESKDSGSICFSISDSIDNSENENDTFSFYIDADAANISLEESYYIYYNVGTEWSDDNSRVTWMRFNVENKPDEYITVNGKNYVELDSLNVSGITKIYIDDVSICTANKGERYMCKYEYYSGSSMACPVVTGAVAILASFYADDNSLQRRERLLDCVAKKEDLVSYCRTGGILDISKIPYAACSSDKPANSPDNSNLGNIIYQDVNQVNISSNENILQSANYGNVEKVYAKKIKLNRKKATLRYGKRLKLQAAVLPSATSDKKVKWYISAKNKKYLTVNQNGIVKAKKKGIGHNVKVYVKAKDGSGALAFCTVKIRK